MTQATIITTPSATTEYAPDSFSDAPSLAVYDIASLTHWNFSKPTGMQGVAAGSSLPFAWLDRKNIPSLVTAPRVVGQGPKLLQGTSGAYIGYYTAFGYGNSAYDAQYIAYLTAAGTPSGYATNEVITFPGGLQIQVRGILTGGVPTDLTVVNPGVYTAETIPTNPVAQASTTGVGTGLALNLTFRPGNGALGTPSGVSLLGHAGGTIAVLFRAPVPGGVAGGNPGGCLIGNKDQFYLSSDIVGEVRSFSIQIGYATQPGRLVAYLAGTQKIILAPSATDFRDGKLHFAVLSLDYATATAHFHVDGALINTAAANGVVFNPVGQPYELSIASAGSNATGITAPYVGDIISTFAFNTSLPANAPADLATLHAWASTFPLNQ